MLEEILENLKRNKDRICYEINENKYSAGKMYQYICNIYKYILENNKDKTPIIVCGYKDVYMIASFLACACAGIAYVPIDDSMPTQRKEEIINQISPRIIIDKNIEKIMEADNYDEIKQILMKPEDVYYIIYTSGSTGKPKGVKITYENIQSCICWLKDICKIENGTILNQANFSFDLSVADIYLSLTTNSKHFIIDRQTQQNYNLLFERLKQSDATLAIMTPSFAEFLLIDSSFGKKLMPKLKQILFCGEKLTRKTIKKLYDRFDDKIEIINSYGPTECTFAVTSTYVSKEDLHEEISIGIPKKNVQIYIVDNKLKSVKDEELGQILITGESVAVGYVEKELNKNKFINFNNQNAYLTGDLGYIKNHKLYYAGRMDRQVKYKGYRIELEDIEKAIYKLTYVDKVIVATLKGDEEKISKIIAFVKLDLETEKTEQQIKKDLTQMLPEYMCPIIKIIKDVPLNKNGKCDEEKLLKEYV